MTQETPEQSPIEPEGEGTNNQRTLYIVLGLVLIIAVLVVGYLAVSGAFSGEPTPTPTITTPVTSRAQVTIVSPVEGAILDVINPIVISGTGAALFEGNVVVQALDDAGNVLVEQPTTIQSPDAGTGGAGPWMVELLIPVKPGIPGKIYAFSTSPVDGSILASDSVTVTFGEEVVIETFIEISEPVDGAVLDISQPVTIKGTGGGLFEGNVVVQALADDGTVLIEQPTILQAPDAGTGGAGPWELQLTIMAELGSNGTIRAFSPSPVDGSDMAADSLAVTYGESVEMSLQIVEPVNGTVLDITSSIPVQGIGVGLPEDTILVRAVDQGGNILAEQTTTPDEAGNWATELSVETSPGTQGQIEAMAPAMEGDQVAVSTRVDVTYGPVEPGEEEIVLEDHLWLLESLNGTEVLAGSQITADFNDPEVVGSAGCNRYFADYTRTATEINIGPAGVTRMACQEPQGVMEQEAAYLALLEQGATYQIADSKLEIANEAGELILVYAAAVVGNVVTEQPAELPEGAVVQVQLNDVSRADAPAVTIGEQTISGVTTFPITFAVTYDPGVIDERFTYAIQVRITDSGGNLLYINTQVYPVITRDNPSQVDVSVEPQQ